MQTCRTGSSSCIIKVVDAESRVHNIVVHIGLFIVSGVVLKVSSRVSRRYCHYAADVNHFFPGEQTVS
jgi:hypothetical protein